MRRLWEEEGRQQMSTPGLVFMSREELEHILCQQTQPEPQPVPRPPGAHRLT